MGAALAASSQAPAAGTAPALEPPAGRTGRPRRRLPSRIAGRVAVLLLLAVVLCFAGVELATPDGTGYAQGLDRHLERWLAAHAVGARFAPSPGADLVGGVLVVVLVGIVAGVWLARRTGRRGLALAPLFAVAVVQAVVLGTKAVVGRPRPDSHLRVVGAAAASFPSAPVASGMAIAVVVARLAARASGARTRPAWLVPVVAAGALAIAATITSLPSQWPSDVIAGAVAGVVVGVVVAGLVVPSTRRTRPRWVAPAVRLAGVGALVALIPVGVSYVQALRYPGQAAASVRTVDWLRDGGFGGAVDRAESWWLWHHAPTSLSTLTSLPPLPAADGQASAPGPASRRANLLGPRAGAPVTPADGGANAPGSQDAVPAGPVAMPPIVTPVLPGEGQWTALATGADGRLQIAASRLRPDPAHPDLVVTLAWMDPAAVRFALVAGTREPGGGAGPWGAQVPPDLQPTLLAAFNSGFKMKDTPGGAIEEGRQQRVLQDGLATFVVRADGTATIGQWGRDVQLGADVVAVRQNLRLIIDGGEVLPGLRLDVGGQWGKLTTAAPVWRSGVGIDASGRVIYASGNQLTLDVLAEALRRAGAVRAMELDIHNHMVTYNLFAHPAGSVQPVGQKLSPDMTVSADRYLAPDQRDFIAVFAR